MTTTTRNGTILQLGDSLRIETGPRRVEAEATKELLANDMTADHYQAPRRATAAEISDPNVLTIDGQRVTFDADGKPIQLGETMAYLDWLGHGEGREGATVHYVYALEPRTAAERKTLGIADDATDQDQTHVWREIAVEADEAAAITAAMNYAVKGA